MHKVTKPRSDFDLDAVRRDLSSQSFVWLVTGAAGFIGSNLVEALLLRDQTVFGLDNFATGYKHNLDSVRDGVGALRWGRFRFIEADIRDLEACHRSCDGVDVVLHHAALGSVPRSVADPVSTNQVNVDGFLNMLVAARDAGVDRFVYAASSSTYGDHPALPKVEDRIGRPLSPYAVTKYANELYARVFQATYGLQVVGLRYFNVFGRRQDPDGAYAAVIPRWIRQMLNGERCVIHGDGETTRDFCYIDNVVQANLLAARAPLDGAESEVFNVAVGDRTTLNELFYHMRDRLASVRPALASVEPTYSNFRPGDVRHSQADISKARRMLGYRPTHSLRDGIGEAIRWYVEKLENTDASAALLCPEKGANGEKPSSCRPSPTPDTNLG